MLEKVRAAMIEQDGNQPVTRSAGSARCSPPGPRILLLTSSSSAARDSTRRSPRWTRLAGRVPPRTRPAVTQPEITLTAIPMVTVL